MDKYIYDDKNGLLYELQGDYRKGNHLCISTKMRQKKSLFRLKFFQKGLVCDAA